MPMMSGSGMPSPAEPKAKAKAKAKSKAHSDVAGADGVVPKAGATVQGEPGLEHWWATKWARALLVAIWHVAKTVVTTLCQFARCFSCATQHPQWFMLHPGFKI